jgi:phospholipid-binding lipoprotein MlaA
VSDKYSFVRDAYQLRREFLIYDGQPPEDFSEEELFKDENLFQDEELFKDELSNDGLLDDTLLEQDGMKSNMEIMDIETTPVTEPAVDR